MTQYTIPPNNTNPLVLNKGDVVNVLDHGKSQHVTVNEGASEYVVKGGTSVLTTINDGREVVRGGAADLTTINGGFLVLDHATADHTKLNGYGNQLDLHDGSVADNTVIANGSILANSTSTIDNVTFVNAVGPFVGKGIGLEDPHNFKGTITGLAVGDVLQFGGLAQNSPSMDVTSFDLKNNILTITYNNDQHASYQLKDMQSGTTFKLSVGADHWGTTFSTLVVTKAPAHADVGHSHSAPELALPLVGVDAHHHDLGHQHLFG